MDTPSNNPTIEDDIKQVLSEVPSQIRAFFASGKVEIVAKNLMQKYQLHVDQSAITEREIILLLLGLKDPAEFAKALAEEAKLDQKIIENIIKDINEQIFVPLRAEEMKSAGVSEKEPEAPRAWGVSAPPAPKPSQVNAPVPSYAYAKPKQSSPQYFHLENKIPPPLPTPTPPTEKRGQTSLPSAPPTKMLEDHEEPHLELKRALAQIVPSQIAPLRMAEVRQVNKAEVPPNLPGVVIPPTPVAPSTPIVKSYSSDPYREPIDEK